MATLDRDEGILLPVERRMSRPTVVLLSLAAACAALAAWLWWSGPDVDPLSPPAPDGPGSTAPLPAPELPAGPARPLPQDALRVRLSVTARERFVPPPPVRVQAVHRDGRALPSLLFAGAGAGFDGAERVTGAAMVRVELDGRAVLRQVAVAADALASVVVGAPLTVTGSVRDADGRPVAGARVWFGEFDSDGNRREVDTDVDGAYRSDVPAGAGVPCVVRAPGRAWHCRMVSVEIPVAPCDVVLQPGATLEVQLAAAATAMHDARLFVVPLAPVSTELASWPFFLQALHDGEAIDERGRALVEGLPRTGSVGVVVRHPRAALPAPQPVVLKVERPRATLPLRFVDTSLAAQVVDERGQPLQGVSLWLCAGGRSLQAAAAQRLVPPHLDAAGTFASRSDADGRFVLGRPAGQDLVLLLRGNGFAGRDLSLRELVPDQPLVLPQWLGGEPEFVLTPPRAGSAWFGETDLSGGLRIGLDADANWRVSLPYAGRFDVELTTFVGSQAGEPVRQPGLLVTGTTTLASPAAK
jgi:hypothetical protein